MGIACSVGIVFCLGAVGDDEHLHIVVEATACPKRIAFVAVDLVEGLLERHTTAFQLAMYQRQAIDEDSDIITIGISPAFRHILVEHLRMIVVDILFVDELHVLGATVVTGDVDNLRALDARGLVLDGHLWRSDMLLKKLFPLLVGEGETIEAFHLMAQVIDELRLSGDVDALVALFDE